MATLFYPDRPVRAHERSKTQPVVILNMSYSGLGIARALAGRGIRIVGLSADRGIYGNFTRSCEVTCAPDSETEPERLAAFLLDRRDHWSGAVIFPTNDFDVLFLDRFRRELAPHYRLAVPPADRLIRIIDKRALVEAAQRAGGAAPRTRAVGSAAELARAAAEVGFPLVVKPISSYHWLGRGNRRFAGGAKAFRADNPAELNDGYLRVAEAYPAVLIQEYIPGGPERLAVLGGYAGENSELLAYFTAKKIIQAPDEFGTGCLVESKEIPELLEPTERLLRELRYQGMAETEYKFDARTGEYKLIEINPRHWDWHQLGSASGINLTWTAYRHLTGRPVSPLHRPVRPVKWIAEDTLAYCSLRDAAHGALDARKLWSGLSGQRIYGIFAWSDPLPFVCYSLTVGLPRLGKKIYTELRGKIGRDRSAVLLLGLWWSFRRVTETIGAR